MSAFLRTHWLLTAPRSSLRCSSYNFKRTLFSQSCLFAPQKHNDKPFTNESDEDKARHSTKKPLSLTALRLYRSQSVSLLSEQSSLYTYQEEASKDKKAFPGKMGVLADEIGDLKTSIMNDVDDSDLESDFLDADDDSDTLEFITLPELNQKASKKRYSQILGTEDHHAKPSTVPCSGCGAHLQCSNRTLPGFIASEYFKLQTEQELKGSICQRCDLMQHQDLFMEVSTTPEEYAEMISKIKPTRSAVLMVVDVMDIQGSIVPNLSEYIGYKHPLIVVGNKADLLAPDCPDYLKSVQSHLKFACTKAGLRSVHKCLLVSAKTGYGIEKLITTLFSLYKKRVDVYIVGTANAGKSSLFNMLLGSDYCKHTARDLIQRATVSVWPGTTLNLLKFPIMRPSSRTTFLRHLRLKHKAAIALEEARLKTERGLNPLEKTWELKDEVSTTDLRTDLQRHDDEVGVAWGQEMVSYQGGKEGHFDPVVSEREKAVLEEEDYTQSYWMYDTPGIINPHQVLNLLTPEETTFLVPESAIIPRTAMMKCGQTLFIGGLGRLDYVEGKGPVFLAIHTSHHLPVYIHDKDQADQFYSSNIGSQVLEVPKGTQERLWKLPALVGEEFNIEGLDETLAAADIQLSSLGWVSVAPRKHCCAKLRAYTPGKKGLSLRSPALLPAYTKFRGKRIYGTQFYRTLDPGAAMAGRFSATDIKDEL